MTPRINTFISSNDYLSTRELNLILFGHAAFQYLNAGCNFRIFDLLHESPLTKEEIGEQTGLKTRPLNCLLLGLTSLGLVLKIQDTYRNSLIVESFFKNDMWKIFRDVVRFEADIVYEGQSDFTESLKTDTNVGLRHIPGSGKDLYHRLSQKPELKHAFYDYMSSWSQMSIPLLLGSIDFSNTAVIGDIGGGDATIAMEIAQSFKSPKIKVFEIPSNAKFARERVLENNLDQRIDVVDGDMFEDPFPSGCECFLFVHQLVIWPKERIKFLMKKAYDSLPENGFVVIFNSITSDNEDGPLMGALDSVYFISIPAEGGMIHPWKLYEECLREAGFADIRRIEYSFWSPHGTIVAYKNQGPANGNGHLTNGHSNGNGNGNGNGRHEVHY